MNFNTTRKKIALFFSLFSSLLILLMSFVSIFLFKYEIDRQAESTLEDAMKLVVSDYQADRLYTKDTSLLSRNEASPSYEDSDDADQALPNIAEEKAEFEESQKKSSSEKQKLFDKEEVQDGSAGAEKDESNAGSTFSSPLSDETTEMTIQDAGEGVDDDFTRLQELKQVYSRVILPDGGILFSSDLFDKTYVDPDNRGFKRLDLEGTDIYLINHEITSGEDSGTTIQVAQYSPFTDSQERMLYYLILGGTFFLIPVTYIVGLFIGKWFLNPLEKSVKQTREFTHNVYHELMTPITVAMTTVDASKATKDFKGGIKSLSDDLNDIYNSLNVLKEEAINHKINSPITEPVNLSDILKQTIQSVENEFDRDDLVVNTLKLDSKVLKKADKTIIQIILKNILSNAFKYASPNSTINVSLNKKELCISNRAQNLDKLDKDKLFERGYRGGNGNGKNGKGFGLAITKELCESLGWEIRSIIPNSSFTIQILI